MRIAVWDEPALDHFARAAEALSEQYGFSVQRYPRRPIRDLLISGDVDIALLPTLSAFLDAELLDVLPAVAISSWDFPFIRLNIKNGIVPALKTIGIDPGLAQEALVTKVVLKEHYDLSPVFKPFAGPGAEAVNNPDFDGVLYLSDPVAERHEEEDGFKIDLGRDWYELTNYPMIWGLFAMRTGEGSGAAVNVLREIASYTEANREAWVAEEGASEDDALRTFHVEGIRYRLDDLATASLTSFQDYLYYNDAVEDMAPLPFFQVPEGEASDEEGPLL